MAQHVDGTFSRWSKGVARVELMIRRFGVQLVYYIERAGGVCKVFATIDVEEACTTYLEWVAELQSAVDHPDERS